MTELHAPAHVAVVDAIAPSKAVAIATGRHLHDLLALRASKGEATAQIEAMAMHNAAVAFLRPRIGTSGVQQLKDLVLEEGARIDERDAEMSGLRRRSKP